MKVKATFEQIEDGLNGGCTACGKVIEGGVEPDARNYECEHCGEKKVFGLEELLIDDGIEIVGEDGEEDYEEYDGD